MSSVKRLSIGIVVSVVAVLGMLAPSHNEVNAVSGGWLANCARYHNEGGGAVLCYPNGYPNSPSAYRVKLQICVYGVFFCKYIYGPARYNGAVSSVAINSTDWNNGYRAQYVFPQCLSYCYYA